MSFDWELDDMLWTGKHIKKSQLQVSTVLGSSLFVSLFLFFFPKAFNPFQKINHFPRTYEITRKDRLFKNVSILTKNVHNCGNLVVCSFLLLFCLFSVTVALFTVHSLQVYEMSKKFPEGHFEFLPKTYVLPEEHDKLRKRLHKTDERWILKPNSSR